MLKMIRIIIKLFFISTASLSLIVGLCLMCVTTLDGEPYYKSVIIGICLMLYSVITLNIFNED